MTRTRKAPLRYYVYISDYKLDMLYEQISPSLRRRISGELKVDLKLASLTLHGSEQPEATRMTKLRVVERYIDRYHHVGSVENPGREFFRGSMDMRWGWLTPRQCGPDCNRPMCNSGDRHCIDWGWEKISGKGERISPVVLFRGTQRRTQGCDFVLLGGSRRHVLGLDAEKDPTALLLSGSLMDGLIDALQAHVSQFRSFQPSEENLRKGTIQYAIEAGVLMTIEQPTQRLKFLAVPYGQDELRNGESWPGSSIKWKGNPLHGVIGTPIYVALEQNY